MKSKEEKRGMFINFTHQKSKYQIKQMEELRGRPLREEEKKKIIERNAKIAKVRVVLISAGIAGIFSLGGIVGNTVTKQLNQGKEQNKIEIDLDEQDKPVEIKNMKDERDVWINNLKVDIDEIDNNEELRQNVEKEINNLKDSQEVLDYLKKMYIDEFNTKNGNLNVDVDDIILNKDSSSRIYQDEAENGDTIYRRGAKQGKPVIEPSGGTIEAVIFDNGNVVSYETVANTQVLGFKPKFVNVYTKDIIVKEDKETALEKVGPAIEYGIYYLNEFSDSEKNEEYKNGLIDAVVQYKKDKIEQIVHTDVDKDKQNTEISVDDTER